MGKQSKSDDDFIDLELDHEGKSTFKFVKELDKRADAIKRMFVWAMANDLYELVTEKIPKGKRYDKLIKSLKVGEGDKGVFAVYIDNKAKGIKKIDAQKTLIYIRPRHIQDKPKKEIQILADYGPWTIDTLPFWPSRKDAVIVQRKVDQRTVSKIADKQDKQKDKGS